MRADALRRQAHEPRDRGLDAAFLGRARAVQVDIDRQRLGDADRVGELDRATAREPGGDDILREIARDISGRAVDLGRILAAERAAAMRARAALSTAEHTSEHPS